MHPFIPLRACAGITKANTIIYRATEHDCGACEYKSRCCPKVPRRKITRSIYESSREVARAIAQTPAYKMTRRQRKKVEMLFAHMKRTEKGVGAHLVLILGINMLRHPIYVC